MGKKYTWEGLENLKNAMELVEEFKKKIKEKEVQQVEKRKAKEKERKIEIPLNPEAEKFKRSELLEKYIARILFGWNNRNFENEDLKKRKSTVIMHLDTSIFLFFLSIFLNLIFLFF